MYQPLKAWMRRAADGGSPAACAEAAARAVSGKGWDVLREAGPLARCTVDVASRDMGLTGRLRVVAASSHQAVVNVPEGAPFPVPDHAGNRRRGAFDTPRSMVQDVVRGGLAAMCGDARVALDPACGTGAFLVGLGEVGVEDVRGIELDPRAAAVARIAAPFAQIEVGDGMKAGPPVDLVVGNPPYVPPERQDKAHRRALRVRFPWLTGRFDLSVPFAASAMSRVRRGGGCALVLPHSVFVQRYGTPLRRRWLREHRIGLLDGPVVFPGVTVRVVVVAFEVGGAPGTLPSGIEPAELLRLESCPLDAIHRRGDVDLVEHVRAQSRPLGELALVDTGLVAHGPLGGKARLIEDEPGTGRVPYADAREFFLGTHRWLSWRPEEMHRSKTRGMFEEPKIVVQRIRGERPPRVGVCRRGIYVGHTCTVVQPHTLDLDRVAALLRSPLVDGLVRLECGTRLDLYPRDIARVPVPLAWMEDEQTELEHAWDLSVGQRERLLQVASARS